MNLAKVPGLRWRLYYEGGETFDNLQGDAWDTPKFGCVGVVQTDSMWNAERLDGEFFIYRQDTGKWTFHGPHGLMDYLVHFAPVIVAVRPGRYVTSTEWNAIRSRMNNDPDFWAPAQKDRRDHDQEAG